jgi:hydrogenase maturation protein HypF
VASADRGYAIPNGDWELLVRTILEEQRTGWSPSVIAYSLHAALARCAVEWAQQTGLPDVVLTGGCFQNALLLQLTHNELTRAGFRVVFHQMIPPNDGGLAMGQLAIVTAMENE